MSTWLTWAGTDEWRAESAQVWPGEGRFAATGVQLGVVPLPYRLDYQLEIAAGWVTATLDVLAAGNGWRRSLHLARAADGTWSARTHADGHVEGAADLPEAGCDPEALTGALDCDLGFSPLTNTMPILRRGLHRGGAAADLTMAWVSVPDLAVHPSAQRYEHVRATPAGAVVGFSSGAFSAELTVDADGFVLDYPDLARRVR